MPLALQILLTSILSLPLSLLDGWDAVVTARLNARLKALRDADDPTTMAELAKTYPEPPPGKNAAPVYIAAFRAMEALEERGEVHLARLPLVGGAQLPPPGAGLPAPMLTAIGAYLKDNAELLALLHKAAAIEGCKFELDFAQGVAMEQPHLMKLHKGVCLMALEALERTEAGKGDAAADSLIACLRMGESVRREPILLSTLVRIACDAIAVEQVERWASRARPSPEALARVEAALAAAGDPRLLEGGLVGQRCFGIDIYQTDVLKPGAPQFALGPADPMLLHMLPKAYFKSDMICYLDIMNDYVAAARKPYPEGCLAGARVSKQLDERIPRYYVISRMLLPRLGRVFADGQKHLARTESARVALAALRYKAKHGRLPEKLDELVPDFIEAVPLDPFDGKPLRYKADAAGLTVYAVGENGKDDGGATQQPADGKPLDIGFRIRRPKAEF